MKPEGWRPWGYWESLTEEEKYKVKKLVVLPGQRISLQYHLHREEHWVFVSGLGRVVRGEESLTVMPGFQVYIPKLMYHRVENPNLEPLVFIEVQQGECIEESDVVRVEDDYGRGRHQ